MPLENNCFKYSGRRHDFLDLSSSSSFVHGRDFGFAIHPSLSLLNPSQRVKKCRLVFIQGSGILFTELQKFASSLGQGKHDRRLKVVKLSDTLELQRAIEDGQEYDQRQRESRNTLTIETCCGKP